MNSNITIFIIEDDPDINEILEDNLWREGYRLRTFTHGEKALDAIMKTPPDLIILDLNLPGMSGLEICKYIRNNEITADIPVIMLTARSEEIDKIIGFEVGADDYMTKPFSPRELLARIRVHLRRSKKLTFDEFEQGPLWINFATHEVKLEGTPVNLTPIQFKLLKTLILANGKALSRQQLLERVWGEDYYGDPRTVDVHITRLRDKLGDAGKFIITVKGVGYRWRNS